MRLPSFRSLRIILGGGLLGALTAGAFDWHLQWIGMIAGLCFGVTMADGAKP